MTAVATPPAKLEPHHAACRSRTDAEQAALAGRPASRQDAPVRGPVAVPEPPNTPPRVFGDSAPGPRQHGTDQPDTARSPK